MSTTNELHDELVHLGFSSTEARIYLCLIGAGEMTGYQIGKELSLARSSVYPALDALYARGAVSLIQGQSASYAATNPETFITRLRDTMMKSADILIEGLKDIRPPEAEHKYLNIEGFDAAIARIAEVVDDAATEVLVDSDFPLSVVAQPIARAIERGVRVIVFSWGQIDRAGLAVEYYTRSEDIAKCKERRLIVVADMRRCVMTGTVRGMQDRYSGVYSENQLFVFMTAEHILLDIYMKKLTDEAGRDLVTKRIAIGTLLERMN
jgi:HTH-type transcriptional regulator, sugar sensing transcriptional regulator